MDLGLFADEVLEAVEGICGDRVVETHEQAANVLNALSRRPGMNSHELAAVFGVTYEQLERCRHLGKEDSNNEVYENIIWLDAVYTWNKIIQRINEAAHWREEYRDMQHGCNEDDHEEVDDTDTEACNAVNISSPDSDSRNELDKQVNKTREKARTLLTKYFDTPAALTQQLVQRLEDEIFEHHPGDNDYRHATRTIAANLRRNTMLATGYAMGRVPPQWVVLASTEALATRYVQLNRRLHRNDCLKESLLDDEAAELRRQAWAAAKGTDLAPPPPNEDPFS